MALSNETIRKYTKRILLSRTRLLCENGFYGILLMHMKFAIDEECKTAATDGTYIYFGPKFLETLTDSELDFVMMHEILHVVLKHCLRGKDFEPERFNIACDIVVNSNILYSNNMDLNAITLSGYGPSMHLTPNKKHGYLYTAEEVYYMLPSIKGGKSIRGSGSKLGSDSKSDRFDDHSGWKAADKHEDSYQTDMWDQRLKETYDIMKIRDPSNERGTIPAFAERIMKELRKPQTDWRTILNNFVQEEVVDFSFTPPDYRFDDNPFYLPDFNETDTAISNILFMIDTSGSMSDDMVTAAYSEIKGAIDQFNGRLKGWLGFFDAVVIEPKPFVDEEDFLCIKPKGGGGTSFHAVFSYIHNRMQENPPSTIIIMTDGIAPFPDESAADDIPVLWLLNNERIQPPWGRVARIEI